MFSTLPDSIKIALNIVRPLPWQVGEKEPANDENVVMQLDSQPALKECYGNRLLLFSAAEWVKPELGVKRRSFDQKGPMYVEIALRKRNMETSPLESRAYEGV